LGESQLDKHFVFATIIFTLYPMVFKNIFVSFSKRSNSQRGKNWKSWTFGCLGVRGAWEKKLCENQA